MFARRFLAAKQTLIFRNEAVFRISKDASKMTSLSTTKFKLPYGFLVFAFIVTLLPGCAMRGTIASWDKKKREQSFKVEYTLQNANREIDPWSSFAEDGFQTAKWTPSASSNSGHSQPAELTVEYPHPDGVSETALATLLIYSEKLAPETFQTTGKSAWYSRMWPRRPKESMITSRPAPSEVITMELPRERFESMMNELNRSQYLDENDRSVRAHDLAALRIVRDQREIHSSNEIAPLMNELVRNVYANGDVIKGDRGFQSPSVLQTSGIEAPKPARATSPQWR